MQPSSSADDHFSVGDRVGFRILNVFGTVKFFGSTDFAGGNWVGLDLDLPVGTSDGEVRGKRYFACSPARGVFARPAALKRVDGDLRSSISVVDLSHSFGSLERRSVTAAPRPPLDDGKEPPDPPPAPQERCAPNSRPGRSIKITRSANKDKATPTVEVSESNAPERSPVERVMKVVEVIKEVPVEKIVEVERVREVIKEVEVVKTVPVEKIVEVEKEVIKFVPVEKIVEVPKEVFRPLPAQKEIQEVVKEVEVIKEVPVEKIVEIEKEVVKEIPVEKIVERVVEVEKEVVKEVPVETIREVEKEVVREVPVEKIVEVEKEVIREVPVEKIVEVEVVREVEKEVVREVPVEKIVEVVKEVPVETIVEKIVEVEKEATMTEEAKPQMPSDLITQALSEIMEDLREEVQAQYLREKLAKNQVDNKVAIQQMAMRVLADWTGSIAETEATWAERPADWIVSAIGEEFDKQTAQEELEELETF